MHRERYKVVMKRQKQRTKMLATIAMGKVYRVVKQKENETKWITINWYGCPFVHPWIFGESAGGCCCVKDPLQEVYVTTYNPLRDVRRNPHRPRGFPVRGSWLSNVPKVLDPQTLTHSRLSNVNLPTTAKTAPMSSTAPQNICTPM